MLNNFYISRKTLIDSFTQKEMVNFILKLSALLPVNEDMYDVWDINERILKQLFQVSDKHKFLLLKLIEKNKNVKKIQKDIFNKQIKRTIRSVRFDI